VKCPRLLRALPLSLSLAATPLGCYRAEIDLSPVLDESESTATDGGGGASCDDSPLDATQLGCRLLLPTRAECSAQDAEGWSGCYDGGCSVCSKSVRDYPYYFDWHPCCLPNDDCHSNSPLKCNARCPSPTERDKVKPCFVIESQLQTGLFNPAAL
jgi:hypothetical protein